VAGFSPRIRQNMVEPELPEVAAALCSGGKVNVGVGKLNGGKPRRMSIAPGLSTPIETMRKSRSFPATSFSMQVTQIKHPRRYFHY